MPSPSTYAVFLATAIVLLLVPGPAVLYVVTRSIEMGRGGGLASVAGITTGTVAYVALATAGLSSLILASSAAFDAVNRLTGSEAPTRRNPAAVALGRLGGRKGGIARKAKLSPEQRREIARKAAKARWERRKSQ